MTDLARLVRDQGLSFLLVSFTDLFGVQRSKLVPASAVAAMAEAGAGFAGFAAWLDLSRRWRRDGDPRSQQPDAPALAAPGGLGGG
jgi:glutamine synthetase